MKGNQNKNTINLNGKEFTQYPGLLDEAHRLGLKRIITQLVQIPDDHNGQMAIVTAEVHMGNGKVFTGIGDANPKNVNRNIAAHLLRMAETRAKARALRDATNQGGTALEETDLYEGDDDEPSTAVEGASTTVDGKAAQAQRTATATASKPREVPPGHHPGGCSHDQVGRIQEEMNKCGWSQEQGRDYLRRTFDKASRTELTKAEANRMITYLQSLQVPGEESAPV